MIQKTSKVDVITIVNPETGNQSLVQYRIATTFMDGNEVIAEKYHRDSLSISDYRDDLPPIVKAFCQMAWNIAPDSDSNN